MNATIQQIISALLAVLGGFVPAPLRWAVALLADLFKQKAKELPPTASAEAVTADAPDGFKDIVHALFASVKELVSGRPFLLAVVNALEKFVVNNLLDAIFDKLTTGGVRMDAGAVPLHYQPANADALAAELEAAAILDG